MPDVRSSTQGDAKVKTLYLATVLALCGVVCARGAATGEKGPALRVTAEVVGRRYCAAGKLNILQLSIRLRYQNVGGEKLILYRGKNFFYQTKIRGGAAGKPYEVVVLNSRYNDAQVEAVNDRRPGAAFITLPPGGTYETAIVNGVGVTPGGPERVAHTIEPGEHTLQIGASTWYESRKLAEELRGRWRGEGLLWIDPVVTPPLKFDVGGDAAPPPCR
jgi:hypothetical protein